MYNRIRKIILGMMVGALALSIMTTVTPVSATKKAKENEIVKEVDLNGTYHARMGLQTADTIWMQRWGYFDDSKNETFGTENDDSLYSKKGKKMSTHEGTFTDAEIAGNGTYTVSLDGANFEGETTLSQLQIATDIPQNDDIKFTNLKVTIDGKEFVTFDEAVMENEEPYLTAGEVILLLNHWRPELIAELETKGGDENAVNGWSLLTGQGDESIQITFTVSGMAYDNASAQPTQEPTAAPVDPELGQGESNEQAKGASASVVVVIIVVAVVLITGTTIVVTRKRKK